jgi:2-keto-4-pentenoate hydratase/2-oxohepta-3-ene-1,7-dioic acid hydratase in catechol pathway
MSLHIAHFEISGQKHWGIIDRDNIIHILPKCYKTTAELLIDKNIIINFSVDEIAQLTKVEFTEVKILSPVIGNKRVICQGANYRQHMIESGMNPDKQNYNMFFNKSSAAICSAQEHIIKPKHVCLLDYEIELGLVMGSVINKQTDINHENICDYIGAIVIGNDVSAREVQISQTQFFKGKSYRTFCPVGPYLCLIDETNIDKLTQLNLELKVNGEIRQKDNTKNLVFKPAETLTELSSFSDLDIGDLVLTGTPSGCALQIPAPIVVKLFSLLPESIRWTLFKKIQGKSPKYLKINDKIEARIYSDDGVINLGCQENIISE